MKKQVIKAASIKSRIFTIRGRRVMLDRDLADIYDVPTHRLNEAVKRNIERFPKDFMFQLTQKEWDVLRSQFVIAKEEVKILRSQIAISKEGKTLRSQSVISKDSRGGRRYLPYAFTEHGVLMLSNVLNSTRAVDVSIQIIRVFDKLRKYVIEQKTKDTRVEEIRRLLMLHIENSDTKFANHDEAIRQIAQVLNNFIEKPPTTKRIGFGT